jgi:hypothetical protein
MPRLSFAAVLLFMGLSSGTALARDLQVEVEVLHIGGLLAPAELELLLADERLSIEAIYQPTRLVEGKTARRERTLPLGSKLYAISQSLSLKGAQVERKGRSLSFHVADIHPEHADYRLHSLTLRTPIKPGIGRPQPDLSIDLLNPVPRSGAQETVMYSRHGAFDLGLRLRHRWSDAQGAAGAATLTCHADIRSLGNGRYDFRPHHRMAGLFSFLAPVVQSDPPSRPPAGQRSWRLRAPFPEPLTGWQLSRNHLLQIQVGGQFVERLSLYAEQTGTGHCRRTRSYDALFAGGQLVALQRSIREDECSAEGSVSSHSVTASWLDDGSFSRYQASTPAATQAWDGFAAAAGAGCGTGAAPPASEVQALIAEMRRLRDAFLRP